MKSIPRFVFSALLALLVVVQSPLAQGICFNPDPDGWTGPCQDCEKNTIPCDGVNSFNAATGNVWREIPDIALFAGVGGDAPRFPAGRRRASRSRAG